MDSSRWLRPLPRQRALRVFGEKDLQVPAHAGVGAPYLGLAKENQEENRKKLLFWGAT